MKTLFRFLLVTLFMGSVLIFCASPGISADKTYKIGIATIATHPALEATRDGFIDQMTREGFVEDKNVKYEKNNAEGDLSLAGTIANKFVSQKKDLIFAISTPIAQACVGASRGTIPIVFAAVTDPVAAELVDSWKKPGGNITGTSDWMDVGYQLEIMLEAVPSIKKVGVIYNSGEVNSQVQVDELKKAAGKQGVKVVEATASVSTEIMPASKAIVDRVDAMWFPTDNLVVNSLESVLKVCEDKQVPLFGSETSQTKRGVIASAGLSYYDVGVSAGKQAAQVLNGKDPGSIPVNKVRMNKLSVNTAAAERMGIELPQSFLDKATEVIDQ